ncbi:hypothetical protein QMZ30_02790 [Pantoea sp. EA-12]|uniref:hypothetical protein n=1 Tax=Pantoea sp. EA-12 TaxID=3043303 RepID=UPI0024B54FD7|nr:hypothetical protein [Pantoea sp. EA-12]MDI9219824.1 hypothetical protein [Pantoea sp. EA-12]
MHTRLASAKNKFLLSAGALLLASTVLAPLSLAHAADKTSVKSVFNKVYKGTGETAW